MTDTIISNSPDETRAAGRQLASTLAPGAVIALMGGLGAGKTHFAQGLCEGLGSAHDVTSPTFTLVHEYATERGIISHIDFYRLESERDADALGLDEIFASSECTIVEWADRFPRALPPGAIEVHIDYDAADATKRAIHVRH
jgi:tRNA threonylcarbamoyladenosine biosynthesis protein TsaE